MLQESRKDPEIETLINCLKLCEETDNAVIAVERTLHSLLSHTTRRQEYLLKSVLGLYWKFLSKYIFKYKYNIKYNINIQQFQFL